MKKKIILQSTEYDLQKSILKLQENLPNWERDIFLFLTTWFSDSAVIEVQTSGSTGVPKLISKQKLALQNSALMTGEFFGFSNGKTALLCLPAKYIAGKMMLVRAIEWGLKLDYIEPKNNLQLPNKSFFFAAMTPPQVEANFDTLTNLENLIIGGAPVSLALERKLMELPTKSFATYGMTETVSHIALRKIGENNYTVLPSIAISKDDRNCLIINAPKLLAEPISTNDIVEITSSNTFIWKGRADNIINSGGLKISPEIIEGKIASFIQRSYFVAGITDKKWGEKVALIIEGDSFKTDKLVCDMQTILPKTHVPKNLFFVNKFQYTENGKLKRKETLNLVVT